MIEVAMVFDREGRAIFWPAPQGSAGSIPDDRSLWDVLWENRYNLGGVAHTHPWDCPASPSGTDITTFAAIEAGLGQKLTWPIVTMTHVGFFVAVSMLDQGRSRTEYHDLNKYVRSEIGFVGFEPNDLWKQQIEELRRRSRNEGV
jgi:hypothetical protein